MHSLHSGISAVLGLGFLLFASNPAAAQEPATPRAESQPARPAALDTSASTADSLSVNTRDSLSRAKPQGLADTVYYDAEHIRYDMKERILYLRDDAVAKYQDITLYADTIVYRIADNLFTARGKPQLVEKGDTTVGEVLSYNIKTRRGSVSYATTHMNEEYFTGHRIVKSDENILYIDQGDYTSCAYLESPHYYFYGKNLKIIPKNKAVSRPIVLNVGEAPVFIFPYFIMPLERDRTSGILTPGWGGQPTRGGRVDNIGYYWAPNDYVDLKTALSVREFEEFVLTGSTQYALRYWLTGGISARYALNTNYSTGRRDWTIDYSHDQNITPDQSITLRGRGSLASSSSKGQTFYQAHSEDTREILRQNLHADMTLAKRFDKINANASATVSKDQDLVTNHVTENLPSISFGLPSRPIIPHKADEQGLPGANREKDEPKWFNNIYVGYNASGILKREAWDKDSLPGFTRPALGQTLNVSAPQTVAKYLKISPFFNANLAGFYGKIHRDTTDWWVRRDTIVDTTSTIEWDTLRSIRDWDTLHTRMDIHVDSAGSGWDTTYYMSYIKKRYTRADSVALHDTLDEFGKDFSWNTGISMSTTLYGIFPLKILSLVGIRHTLTPSVTYTFTPKHEQDYLFFPVGGVSAAPVGKQSQSVSISLGNNFEGKVVKKPKKDDSAEGAPQSSAENKGTPFQIVSTSLSTAYDFEKRDHKWSDLSFTASTSIKFARIGFSSGFWLYDENGAFSPPILRSYSIDISPNNFGAGGTFWGGDLLVLNGVAPKDSVEYRDTKTPEWRMSLSPSYRYSSSRLRPGDIFTPSKQFAMSASAGLSFTRHWSMDWAGRFDFVKNKFVDHSLNFRCDMECWALSFDWSPSGVNPGYYFRVGIKKIPEIKWEDRKP